MAHAIGFVLLAFGVSYLVIAVINGFHNNPKENCWALWFFSGVIGIATFLTNL